MTGEPVIERLAVVASTNAELIARLAGGEPPPEDFWLVADRQTGGRGRLGRDWRDGIGNFMGSTVVHLRPDDPPPQTLALVAGIATHATIAAQLPAGHDLLLKWPNDVLLDGGKLAGILLEKAGEAVVIGIGVNLSEKPEVPDVETASLAAAGATVYRDFFAFELAKALRDAIWTWREEGLGRTIARWRECGPDEGTPMRATMAEGETIEGSFADLTAEGALLLGLEDGTMRVIHAGDVALIDPDRGRRAKGD